MGIAMVLEVDQEVVCWDLVLSFDGSHEEERVSELLPHHVFQKYERQSSTKLTL